MRTKLVTFLLFLGILVLTACRGAMVDDIVYPHEVPASFEATIVCQSNGNNDLSYKWHSDNGTIIGTGNTVIWVAPGITGRNNLEVTLTDRSGNEEKRTVNIDVVGFKKKDIDIGANIELKFPPFRNNTISEQFCTYPTNTLEVSSSVPWKAYTKYSYNWSSNGGKIVGPGIKEGTADRIGWTAPGMAGNYTIRLTASDSAGNLSVGYIYVMVKAPHCCEVAPSQTTE